jgi:hypothetical protein
MKNTLSPLDSGRKLKNSAVPPEFPDNRALKSYNGHTRTPLLIFRKQAPERPFAVPTYPLTKRVLSEMGQRRNLSINAFT